jgi:TonB family protein
MTSMRMTFAFFVFTAAAWAQVPASDQRIADLTELIDRKPDFAAAYYARGVMRVGMGQLWPAEQDFYRAIELKPDADAYAHRAEVYAATKRYDQEIADLSQAIGMKPDNVSYTLRRANSYRFKGTCELAIVDYGEVIRRGPNEAAYRGRSACRKQLGDNAGAADDERVADQIKASPMLPATLPPIPVAPVAPAPNPTPRVVIPPGYGTGGGFGMGRGGVGGGPRPATPSPEGVYRIGGGVSQPSLLFKVEPEYSEEARKAKWQGSVTLSVVVSEFGEAQNIKIVRALGLGLDQQAIEAVQKWVFKPGRKDGQPVAVYATIEVTFHLL